MAEIWHLIISGSGKCHSSFFFFAKYPCFLLFPVFSFLEPSLVRCFMCFMIKFKEDNILVQQLIKQLCIYLLHTTIQCSINHLYAYSRVIEQNTACFWWMCQSVTPFFLFIKPTELSCYVQKNI